MIGGIFETIGKTLGGGKQKYFLELDDTAADKAAQTAATTAKAAQNASAKVAEKVEEAASDAVEKVQEVVAAKEKTTEKAPTQPKPAAAKAPASPSGAAPDYSAEELITKAINAAGKKTDSQGNVVEEAGNFSTDYLMPLGNRGRRRPGPSLGAFKGMARNVNPRLRG